MSPAPPFGGIVDQLGAVFFFSTDCLVVVWFHRQHKTSHDYVILIFISIFSDIYYAFFRQWVRAQKNHILSCAYGSGLRAVLWLNPVINCRLLHFEGTDCLHHLFSNRRLDQHLKSVRTRRHRSRRSFHQQSSNKSSDPWTSSFGKRVDSGGDGTNNFHQLFTLISRSIASNGFPWTCMLDFVESKLVAG
jgi:hypothetical protein